MEVRKWTKDNFRALISMNDRNENKWRNIEHLEIDANKTKMGNLMFLDYDFWPNWINLGTFNVCAKTILNNTSRLLQITLVAYFKFFFL